MKEYKQEDLADCYALNILFTINNKQQWEELKARVPRENKLPILIGVSWDITDLKIAEQQLVEAKLEAESNRLKSAFLANMSHGYRNRHCKRQDLVHLRPLHEAQ